MSAYTTNDDLVPVYVPDVAALPDDMTPRHEAAYNQIRRDLRAQGKTDDELDDLTTGTLAALKVPACWYVLYLLTFGQAQAGRNDTLVLLADKHLANYKAALASTPFASNYNGETDDDATTVDTRVYLG